MATTCWYMPGTRFAHIKPTLSTCQACAIEIVSTITQIFKTPNSAPIPMSKTHARIPDPICIATNPSDFR